MFKVDGSSSSAFISQWKRKELRKCEKLKWEIVIVSHEKLNKKTKDRFNLLKANQKQEIAVKISKDEQWNADVETVKYREALCGKYCTK